MNNTSYQCDINDRSIAIEFPDGQKQYFEGTRDSDHIVRVEFPNGQKQYYEGTKGNEHIVRMKLPNNNIKRKNTTKELMNKKLKQSTEIEIKKECIDICTDLLIENKSNGIL